MTSTPILAGKRALVTGGSRGIVAAIVRCLASRGATVAVSYRSDRTAADALVGKLTDQPCEARSIENYTTTGNPGRTCPLSQGG
jgi:3-oxoacyl-[acyl-carrier protein] reductase